MRAMISLCAVLLLAAVGCSKTDNNADRDTAPMDQSTPGGTPGATDDTDAGTTTYPGTMPPDQTTPPPDQTMPPPTDESTPPATPPPNQ